MEPAEKLREQAARAREYARQAGMSEDRAAWLAIAERWERLAEVEEATKKKKKDQQAAEGLFCERFGDA